MYFPHHLPHHPLHLLLHLHPYVDQAVNLHLIGDTVMVRIEISSAQKLKPLL
jgi:hypothetical protein